MLVVPLPPEVAMWQAGPTLCQQWEHAWQHQASAQTREVYPAQHCGCCSKVRMSYNVWNPL